MLSVTQLQNDLRIEKEASDAGYDNIPESNRKNYDTNEQKIVATVKEQVADLQKQKIQQIDSNENKRYDIESKIKEAIDLGLIEEDIKSDFETFKAKNSGKITAKQQEFSRAQRFLSKFKSENKLSRPADYPESNIYRASVISIIFIVEVLLNANMFAVGSVTGYLGGIFSSVLISVINISMGLMAGYFLLRKTRHVENKTRLYGWIGFIVYCLVIPLFFNLLVAHYRAALDDNVALAIRNAPLNFLEGPFYIQNFNSWVLFTVGILVSIISCYEGFTWDDPYPEYGKADRDLKKARKEYEEVKGEFYDYLDTTVKSGRGKINRRLVNIGRWLSEYLKLTKDSEKMVEAFNKTFLSNATSVTKTLLEKYREVNKKVRNSEPPAYFDTLFPEEEELHEFKIDDSSLTLSESFYEKTLKLKEKREEEKDIYLDNISSLRQNMKKDLDDWISNLGPIHEE